MRTASEIFSAASTLLLDDGYVHWSLPELCQWLNFGLDAITLQKPSASAVTETLRMARGVRQNVPDGFTALLRPVRNIRTDNTDRLPRRRITVVSSEALSTVKPDWDDEISVRFEDQVKHVLFDEANPKTFYVYPGNDGTGAIEAVLAKIPDKIRPDGDFTRLESYEIPIPLDETYHDALIDYVMYRAYSKDAQFAGSAQRAVLHYQQFANALGIKVRVEANTSPNIKPGVPFAASGVDQTGGP